MKRIGLVITTIVISLCANAQITIKYRKLLEPEGLSIMTTNQAVSIGGGKTIEYALQYEVVPNGSMHQGYCLNVYFTTNDPSVYIPEGGRFIIRTTQDNVISLTDCGDNYFTEYYPSSGNPYTMDRSDAFWDKSQHKKMYLIHGKFPISAKDLSILASEGIAKLRIETTGEPVECNYKVKSNKPNKSAEAIKLLCYVLSTQIDPYYGLQ